MWHKRERKLMKQATKSIKNFLAIHKKCATQLGNEKGNKD